MPTRATFRMVGGVFVGGFLALGLVRLWAIRHTGDDGAIGAVANAVNIAI